VNDPFRFQQTNFYRFLKETLHFETVILPLAVRTIRCKDCGKTRSAFTEKGVDVALATKMFQLANSRSFETTVLVSGDKDYLETVRAVKAQGMRGEVYSWRGSLSRDLAAESSDDVVYLDDYKAEIQLTDPVDQEAENLQQAD
jgi:uncharacterized LabA/DUF88 family protein